MGDIGSSLGGIAGDASSGLGSAMGAMGSMMGNMMGGAGNAMSQSGNPFMSGGTDPNTGQPIPQETPQQVQAQSQGPPVGTTPPGVDPATQIGGTQSQNQTDPNAIFRNFLHNLTSGRGPAAPTQLPGAQPPDAAGTIVPTNQGGGAYTPTQAGMPAPQNEPGETAPGSQPVTQGMPAPQNEPGETAPGTSGIPAHPSTPTPTSAYGNYGPQKPPSAQDGGYDVSGVFKNLPNTAFDQPKGGADVPAANAQPVSAEGVPGGGGVATGAAQGQGGGMQNIMGNLMSMFLPMIMGAMMGGRGGMGGMGALLPMLMMGGMMGQGGLGQMFGGRRMVPGFRGGFMRPGYYPDGRGGFGFHPGGMHPGWQPHYINAYGGGRPGGGGSVTSAPRNGPWSSSPFLSTLVSAESGGRQGPGVRGDGGMAKGFFQFHDATWQRFARNVPGASQYGSAEDAPPEVQMRVAMTAPISEWGPRTKQILHQRFGGFDERLTIGQLAQQFGGVGATTTAGGGNDGSGLDFSMFEDMDWGNRGDQTASMQ